MSAAPSASALSTLRSRIYGCWLGKSIGGTLGIPAEGRQERQNFSFYNPIPTNAPPNDDLELQLVWLDLVENSGSTLTQTDFGQAWLKHIHYCYDEYARCRWNLRRGVPIEAVGTFENPFGSSMGSPIRSEIWACLFPEDPDSAAYYAAMDASLDHGTEGIAGEVFFAVMESYVTNGSDVASAIAKAMPYLPAESGVAQAIKLALDGHAAGLPAWECYDRLIAAHGVDNFTHAPLNVGLTIWALAYGEGDFEKSILLAVNGGWDTDCTAATAGATLGLKLGVENTPAKWSDPIGDAVVVGPGIIGISVPPNLDALTDRTLAASGKLEPKRWDPAIWTKPIPAVDLATLPGTIYLTPLGGGAPVPFANGELPEAVKAAGGAEWDFNPAYVEKWEVQCLVRAGGKLLADGNVVVECPPNLPYVPGPARAPHGSREGLKLGSGPHKMRLELNSKDAAQDASLILVYPNYHFCPWTSTDDLPDLPIRW